jgi:AraC-like DNA-binding protein
MPSNARPGLDEPIHRPDKIAVLVQALGASGVPAAEVLAGSGVAESALSDTAARVSVRQLLAVHAAALRLTPDPALALRAGARIRFTHFGLYGYALLASTTPRQAIDVALRYRALASPLIGLAFGVDGDEAVWTFDDVLGLGRDSALLRFVYELQLGTQVALHRDLLGAAVTPTRVRTAGPAPAHAALYAELLGCERIEFGCDADELRFDAAWLDHPLAFANPITAATAQQDCDRLLGDLERAAGVAGRVVALLRETPVCCADGIEPIAGRLAMHPRTLRRRLRAEGTTYQRLRDDVRRQCALDWLRRTRMSTDDIAASLGFSDAANFRHAFKRWTGRSPGALRGADVQASTMTSKPP